MLDKVAIARPYARAAFEQARQNNSVQSWAEMLGLAAQIIQEPQLAQIINNPLNSRDISAEMIINTAAESFTPEMRNFIRLLAHNNRIPVLSEIADLFIEQQRAEENRLEINIFSAYPLDTNQEQMLIRKLEKRFKRAINPTIQVDQNLIAGVIVRIGDIVIDGSLRAGLAQMADELRI